MTEVNCNGSRGLISQNHRRLTTKHEIDKIHTLLRPFSNYIQRGLNRVWFSKHPCLNRTILSVISAMFSSSLFKQAALGILGISLRQMKKAKDLGGVPGVT
ncbi:hypothetical protein C8R42DRAFT_637037 [Lentinula raphanica]|nr:hypothetical protein C8R42DRAFT_637037 [Lentinula raphanica]